MAKLSKWQIKELQAVLRTVKETSSIHNEGEFWNEADFNLWAETWVIPNIEKVLGKEAEE